MIEVVGGPLTGKTTAIEYLDRRFLDDRNVRFVDAHAHLSIRPLARAVTVSTEPRANSLGKYGLAPWGQDEWIEYLLAAHPSRCGNVIGRVREARPWALLGGNPCLWRLVLDDLAANDSMESAADSLRWVVAARFSLCKERDALRHFALVSAAPLEDEDELDKVTRGLAQLEIERPILRLLALDSVRTIVAAEALALCLVRGETSHLRRRLPSSLVSEIALTVKAADSLSDTLRRVLAQPDASLHAMAASMLHAADIGWKPTRRPGSSEDLPLPDLSHAYLTDADWSGIELRGVRLSGSQLCGATLENANLEGARLDFADCSGAKLHGALLTRLSGRQAEFVNADLSFARAAGAILQADLTRANLEGALLSGCSFVGANLSGARLMRANLSGARLSNADIEGADFTRAKLQGSLLSRLDLRVACFDFAIFSKARLQECNLEGMELPFADFEAADLRGALLTCSTLSCANLRRADLRGAGLADVEWENVDLREADLRHASFHLGSTRCGLVGSPYPSHGTRTGFYTDDYNEQDFKSPEEIRKANLCGADLRGANIEGVDFYLVDVRGARYDQRQEAHLRQCGAILKAKTY